MCFERDDCCNMASGCELVAPDRSDNSHTLSAGWLERRTLQNPPADFPGGGRRNSAGTGESRGGGGRELAPGSAPDRVPTGGWL